LRRGAESARWLAAFGLLAGMGLPAQAAEPVLYAQAVPAAQQEDIPPYIWNIADAAYRAYAEGKYEVAADLARRAVALRPDIARWHDLLANAEAAAARERDAEAAAPAPAPSPTPTVPDTAAPDVASQVYAEMTEGYAAYSQGDFGAAEAHARKALSIDPFRLNPVYLLVDSVSAQGRPAEAETIASEALARHPKDGVLLAQRGYLRQRAGKLDGAIADFEAAQASGALDPERFRNITLALVDSHLAAGAPQRALDVLAPYAKTADYAVQARRGYALQAAGRTEGALGAFDQAYDLAGTPAERVAMLRGAVSCLAALDRRKEAEARVAETRARGDLDGAAAADLAYLAVLTGDNDDAYARFREADADGNLSGAALLDAGYAAKHAGRNEDAARWFKRALDASAGGDLPLSRQTRFGLKREIGQLERSWGLYSSLIYGGEGVGSLSTRHSAGHALQNINELYWRPPVVGYRDGATVETFLRTAMTMTDELGNATGVRTLQGSAGLRWKPLAEQNGILELSRLFHLGSTSRSDWLGRAAYSTGEGGDLRYDRTDWPFWQVYGEGGFYYKKSQKLANAEARAGWAFRDPKNDNRLLFIPFLGLGWAYDSELARTSTLSAGPGLSLRQWLGDEDAYSVPESYVDMTLQYRFRLAADDRSEGILASILFAY